MKCEEGEDKGGSDEKKKGWEAEQTWIHGSPWRVETCKKGFGDLQKEGEHLPNCADDTSCWRWHDGFMNLTNLHV